MPRQYKPAPGTRQNQQYSESSLQKALCEIRKKTKSIRQASKCYDVPYTTLQRHYKCPNLSSYGGQTTLSVEEEEYLVKGILTLAEWGFPVSFDDMKNIVKSFLERIGRKEIRFTDNKPTSDWVRLFLSRHKDLTIRISENIKRCRAQVSSDDIVHYFDELEKTLHGVPASHIVNYDETNFTDDPGCKKVVCQRGTKRVEKIVDHSKTSTTVMFAATASGDLLPPYTVYKAKNIYEPWMEGGVNGSVFACTASGWFDMATFDDWFTKIIIPWAKHLHGMKVILGDNLSSHISLYVISQCEKYNIKFVLLPPNSTHLCQPLDVAVYHPLKVSWRSTLSEWKQRNRGVLPKSQFPKSLKAALDRIGEKMAQNIMSGFRACGISPVNRQAVLKRLPQRKRRLDSEADNTENAVFSTLLDHLEKFRAADRAEPSRGKKVNIVHGKSVTMADLQQESSGDEDNPEEINGREEAESESGNEPATSTRSATVSKKQTRLSPKEKDFVLVRFWVGRKVKKYVGKIIDDVSDGKGEMFEVDFLRKKASAKGTYFVNPPEPDVSNVQLGHIETVLSPKYLGKGKFSIPCLNDKADVL